MPDDSARMSAASASVADAAISGLLQPRKTLPAKLFYDEEGCRLFRQITELPEYYLTRTELALLAQVAPCVADSLPGRAVLVEYGASDETKADFLLRASDDSGDIFQAYVPIDVAAPALEQMRERLRQTRPDLLVWTLATDFMNFVELPGTVASLHRLGFFPGSTIGNLDPPEAQRFLRQVCETLGSDARFLIGVDLRKGSDVLLPAYDDAAGVTAAFNRNLLVRLNREAEADFDIASFDHRAVWNDAESRIEMHLVSRRDQVVRVGGVAIRFTQDETIHTENSYKYSPEHFTALADASGWRSLAMWTDPQRLFSLHLLKPRGDR